MSVIDKVVNAVTPAETDKDRADVRTKARAIASPGDWFSLILDHHVILEQAFAATKAAADGPSRVLALKKLGVVLMGHAIAEEAVVYPAMGSAGEKGHATTGYDEQVEVKIQPVFLKMLDHGIQPDDRMSRLTSMPFQIATPPLPVRESNVSLWRSKPGASAGLWPLFGNQSFQIAAVKVSDPGRPLQTALTDALSSGRPRVVVLEAALAPPRTTSPRWRD